MAALRVILVIGAIPLMGFIAYWSILWHALGQPNFTAPLGLTFVCEFLPRSHSVFTPELVSTCEQIWPIDWLGIGSVASLLLGLIVPALFWAVAAIVGSNRSQLASVFPPLTFIAILLVAALVLINAAILVTGVYQVEAYWAGRVHFILICGVGAASFLGAIAMSSAAFRMFQPVTTTVFAAIATSADFPKLHELIASIADRISARRPDNVILGLHHEFFATSAKVSVLGSDQQLSGETMCLSLPMLRLLSIGELSAVIAHELSHFSGSDTAYSLRFVPVYRGLMEAVALVDSGGEVGPNLAGTPARVILESMLKAFSQNAKNANRDRESVADSIGVQATSAEDMSYALIKITSLSHLWLDEEQSAVLRLQQRRVARNISQDLVEQAGYEVRLPAYVDHLKSLLDERIAHPTDTHPPTRMRIEAAGQNADSLLALEKIRERFLFHVGACEHLDEMEPVEEQITALRHETYVAHGISIPDQQEWIVAIADLAAALLARMIRADGAPSYGEVYAVEDIAIDYLPSFDRAYFRECCRPKTDLPDVDQLLLALDRKLTGEQRSRTLELVAKIAEEDGAASAAKADLHRKTKAAIPLTI